MADDTRERDINPYTDFGFKKLFEQAEIAKYDESERRQYEASLKEYWDYTSTLDTVHLTASPIDNIVKATGLTAEEIEAL